jgi:transposase
VSRIATVRSDITAIQIRKAIKSTNDGILRLRLMVIEKLISEPNLSLQKVAKALIVNREPVTKCLQLFNKGGIDALKPKQAGRKEGNPKYDDTIFHKLIATLKAQETPWSVYQMQNHIKHTYNIEIPESTIYYRLSKMGYSKKANNEYKKSKVA